jgi:hypothetical protein
MVVAQNIDLSSFDKVKRCQALVLRCVTKLPRDLLCSMNLVRQVSYTNSRFVAPQYNRFPDTENKPLFKYSGKKDRPHGAEAQTEHGIQQIAYLSIVSLFTHSVRISRQDQAS